MDTPAAGSVPAKARKQRNRRNRRKKKGAAGAATPAQVSHADPASGSEDRSDDSGSEDEGQQDYVKGGYHPVQLGELYNSRYRVLSKLGWGQFSTVWLCKDESPDPPLSVVALKIQRSAGKYTEAAMDEITLCSQVRDGNPELSQLCVQLIDSFQHRGPHGTHVCMVFPVCGENLLALIKAYDYRGIPVPTVRSIARQVCKGLAYIHSSLEIIHTDLKPENVVLQRDDLATIQEMAEERWKALQTPLAASDRAKAAPVKLNKNQKKRLKKRAAAAAAATAEASGEALPPEEKEAVETEDSKGEVASNAAPTFYCQSHQNCKHLPEIPKQRLTGIGSNVGCALADFGSACWTTKKFTDDIQTRQYRCPEVIVGAGYSCPADMWSFACLIFELTTGDLLFDPHAGNSYCRDEDHLAQMLELIGPIDKRLALGGKYSRETFDKKGQLKHISKLKFWPLEQVLMEKYQLPEDDALPLAGFLKRMLVFDPKTRATAQELLNDPWLNCDDVDCEKQDQCDIQNSVPGPCLPDGTPQDDMPTQSQELLEKEANEPCGDNGCEVQTSDVNDRHCDKTNEGEV